MNRQDHTGQPQVFFYLVMHNGKPAIEKMTDLEICALWKRGVLTLDLPQQSREDAEGLLAQYLVEHPEWR